jgi:hypothetical protein
MIWGISVFSLILPIFSLNANCRLVCAAVGGADDGWTGWCVAIKCDRRYPATGAIGRRLTHHPVRWGLDSSIHPEKVLANSEFPGGQIIASVRSAQLMKLRCTICRQRLTAESDVGTMAGTRLGLPQFASSQC